MRRRKKQHGLINQMNVVPYIDVMLVLLIIFMVTAPMFVPGVINLPSVGKASQINLEPVQVVINKDGGYSVTQKNQSTQISNIEDLVVKVRTLTNLETPVVVSADKDTKYDNVIKVVDKL